VSASAGSRPRWHSQPRPAASLPEGYAADDGVALLWRDGELVEVVSERSGGRAFRVTRDGSGAVETPLPVRDLR